MSNFIQVNYNPPQSAGIDRLVNTVAVSTLYPTPAIVIDLGTATTFDVAGINNSFEGGVIVPGLHTALQALVKNTALLPDIEIDTPNLVIGTSTKEALLSGALYGYSSMVDGLVAKIKEQFLAEHKVPIQTVVATGGLATVMKNYCQSWQNIRPNLTLEGIQIIANRSY